MTERQAERIASALEKIATYLERVSTWVMFGAVQLMGIALVLAAK